MTILLNNNLWWGSNSSSTIESKTSDYTAEAANTGKIWQRTDAATPTVKAVVEYSLSIPETGLANYYTFNWNANDLVWGNNGIVTWATLTTWRTWASNTAYAFNDSGRIATTSAIATTSTFSIAGWYYFDSLFSGEPLFGQRLTSNYAAYIRGTWEVWLTISAQWDYSSWVSNQVTTGNWVNIVYTISWGSSVKVYVNSVLAWSTTLSWITTLWALSIGQSDSTSLAGGLVGKIDEFAFYTSALSQQEVTDLYNWVLTTKYAVKTLTLA